jgi:hypothetical protein
MRAAIAILFLAISFSSCTPQINCDSYSENYIPVDLNDAINFLDCMWSDSDKELIKNMDENDAIAELHFGTGLSIRNNWGLWRGDTEIAKYFNEIEIHHPDAMSGIILTSFHRYLNNKDILLEEQINEIKLFNEKQAKEEAERIRNEFSTYNINDTVEFSYGFEFTSKQQEESYYNDSCLAKGIVLDMDTVNFKLQVKLIVSCGENGINIAIKELYDTVDGKYVLKEKEAVIMKKDEVKWTTYSIWY